MTKFLDGPAEGVTLTLRRCPRLLRVVFNPSGMSFDALDMAEDVPEVGEEITAYERVGEARQVHLRMSPPKRSGWYMIADYKLYPEQPADAVLRDRESWLAWCLKQPVRLP